MVDWQTQHPLTALTHFDGRNAGKLISLRAYFSELAWMKTRAKTMVSFLVHILPVLKKQSHKKALTALLKRIDSFSLEDGKRIHALEKKVNHDLKALELYVNGKLPKELRGHLLFGLGSEDINSIAFGKLLNASRGEVLVPALHTILARIAEIARTNESTRMIARTHGLAAAVTTFGKELANPLLRLCDELKILQSVRFEGKLSGEVGTFHAVARSLNRVNWMAITDTFIASQGLKASHGATQIVPYDSVVRYLHSIFRTNTILIDLATNMWLYVMLGYVSIRKIEEEVGSSGMPHKVNPIYFEGAKGGLLMANGMIETLARNLPVNMLQREFYDSTMRRNIAIIMGHCLLSYQSLAEAFTRIEVQKTAMTADLNRHAEVWIEPMKTYLIHKGVSGSYELMKKKTRGRSFTTVELLALISSLPVEENIKKDLHRVIVTDNPYEQRMVEEAVRTLKTIKIS